MKKKDLELVYVVTLCDMYGGIKIFEFKTLEKLDEFVEEVNKKENYQQMITEIKKIWVEPFIYEKEIIHRALGFQIENVTEEYEIENYPYSFFKIHPSLKNVKRV